MNATSVAVTTSATSSGQRKIRRAPSQLIRRHAIRGPIPVNRTARIASGVARRLKNGGPTEERVPVIASEIRGKNVPQKITAHSPTRRRLLTRKIASRENKESIFFSDRRSSSREMIRAAEPRTTHAIRTRIGGPTLEAPKAWIESRIPDRTMNVPSSANEHVATISDAFQTFSIPRRSWTMIECRKAVPSSHGISDAFSTGSHAQ